MSDSKNDMNEEEPLGGFYNEEEENQKEKEKIDSAKKFAKDKKSDIDNVKDIVDQIKNRVSESSSSKKSNKSNGTRSNKDNLRDRDTSSKKIGNKTGAEKTRVNPGEVAKSGKTTGTGAGAGGTGAAGTTGAGATGAGATGAGATGAGAAGAGTAGAGAAGAGAAGAGTAGAGAAGAAGAAIPIVIVILAIIGVIGFIGFFTVMPGMILGKLKSFGLKIAGKVMGVLTGDSQTVKVTQEDIKDVAQYVQNLGYDIQTFGFADVKYKKQKNKDGETTKKSTKEIEKIIPINNDKVNDYLTAYIAADAQTYVSSSYSLRGAFVSLGKNIASIVTGGDHTSIDQESSGLINIVNNTSGFGMMDLTNSEQVKNAENYARVDTNKKKLYIYSKAIGIGFGKVRWGKTYSFDLENWTAMYGRPLELFLALHTSTMMPDLTKQIATNDKFNTKVNIDLMRVNMLYDVELKKQDGNTLKFSTDIENTDNPDQKAIDNLNAFIDDFLNNAVEPNNSSIWKDAKDIVNDAMSTNPKAKIQFFKKIHDASKKKGFFSTSDKFDYVDIAKTFQTLDNDPFENLSEEDKKAKLADTHTFEVDGTKFENDEYYELVDLISDGIDNQNMIYPVIRDVTKHWFWGTIDFMGTTSEVTHGAYRRAKIVEKRIKYETEKKEIKSELEVGDYEGDGYDEDDLDLEIITKSELDEYNKKTDELNEKFKQIIDADPSQDPRNKSRAEIMEDATTLPSGTSTADLPDNLSVEDYKKILKEKEKNSTDAEKLNRRINYRNKLAERAQQIINGGEKTEEKDQKSDKENEKTKLEKDYEIYLNTRMSAIDNNSGVFYQVTEPELLGPREDIKKLFSKKFYQYDGTAETAKKIAAAKAIESNLKNGIDPIKPKYLYDGEEYEIQQEDYDEYEAAKKARKEGKIEDEYYNSPMAKKPVNFKNNKKLVMQALAMLESMKTHASDEVYKDIKELLYTLNYFTEEELTKKEKQVLLWIADNGKEGKDHEYTKIITQNNKEQKDGENTTTDTEANDNKEENNESKTTRDDKVQYKLTIKNLNQENMNIIAPGDCTATYNGDRLILTFKEMSQDAYDILNYKYNGLKDIKDKAYTGSFTQIDKNLLTGYTMEILGIKDPGKTEFKRGDVITSVAEGLTNLGGEDNGKIEVILKNEEGSPHDSVEEYMTSSYTKTDEEDLKKQRDLEKESLLKHGYKYTGSSQGLVGPGTPGSGGNSEGIDFGEGHYTEFNMTNAQERALNEEQKAFLIYMYLTERGITPNQAAGIIGNIMQETTLSNNEIWGENGGIFQHTDDLRRKLVSFIQQRGRSFSQSLLEDQLDYFFKLYKTSEHNFQGNASSNMDALACNGRKYTIQYADNPINKISKSEKAILLDYWQKIQSIKGFTEQEALYGTAHEKDEKSQTFTRTEGLEKNLHDEFMGYEQANTSFFEIFDKAPSPETAATAFCRGYERPESGKVVLDKSTEGKPPLPQAFTQKRRFWARKYFDKFTNQAEIDRIKASLPVQPIIHDERAFKARAVTGGTTNNQTTAGADISQLADGQEISLPMDAKYASNSVINTGKAKLYKTKSTTPKGKTITVNAGHGTKGGESKKTLSHPDGTPKVTGGTTKKGAVKSIAVSSGMTFNDGTSEASATLPVALKLRDKLLQKGYNVLMIRESDDVQLDNVARTVIANTYSDAHVAIHYNDTKNDEGAFYMKVPNANGYKSKEPVASTWQRSDQLGESLLSGLQQSGVKIKPSRSIEMDLTQTSYSSIPSIDIEVGDKGTSHNDSDYEKTAEGLAIGIDQYFGG